jgi:hypothetical protein
VQIEAMTLTLRPRAIWEGCDLGIRLLQSNLRSAYSCYLMVALPLFALCFATYDIAAWLPATLIWWSKPWLDRTLLFVLSRALFGTATAPPDVWDAQRDVWWAQLLDTITLRRLSASRSFTQPVRQLEGLTGAARASRVRQLAARHRGVARAMTQAFAAAELALMLSMISLELWLAPKHADASWLTLLGGLAKPQTIALTLSYAAAVSFVEPFYVAAGFGMYLNRRVELEAWDIEQEFRRAFPG